MTKVEEVARALCDDTMKRWRSPIALQQEPWREFIPAARAAIKAMRVPTEAMNHAAFAGQPKAMDDMLYEDFAEAYTKAVDAALSHEGK